MTGAKTPPWLPSKFLSCGTCVNDARCNVRQEPCRSCLQDETLDNPKPGHVREEKSK